MNRLADLFAALRRGFARAPGRSPAAREHDPADMGTAFGLDAISSLENPWTAGTAAAKDAEAAPRSPFELRLHRRSTL